LSKFNAYTLTIDTEIYEKARSEMRRPTHSHRPPLPPSPAPDAFRRRLALAVVALFVGVCLGRLLAPNVQLFQELLPVAAALLGLVVRSYLSGQERE
jgi:hypothetical protein